EPAAAMTPLVNAGNVPLTIVGDGTSAYGAFGANGGAIESNHDGSVIVDRGSGLNDDTARLIGATYDKTTEATVTKIYVGNAQQGLDHYYAPFVGPNTYDSIGAGWLAENGSANGWDGDLGAVIIVSGEISVEDRTKLDMWSQQR